jgi:hypothetical protein
VAAVCRGQAGRRCGGWTGIARPMPVHLRVDGHSLVDSAVPCDAAAQQVLSLLSLSSTDTNKLNFEPRLDTADSWEYKCMGIICFIPIKRT